jgi:hypothetical protein
MILLMTLPMVALSEFTTGAVACTRLLESDARFHHVYRALRRQ